MCVCVLVEMWSEYQCVAANATDQLLFICSYLHALAPSVAMFTYLLSIHANVYCMHVASGKKKKKKQSLRSIRASFSRRAHVNRPVWVSRAVHSHEMSNVYLMHWCYWIWCGGIKVSSMFQEQSGCSSAAMLSIQHKGVFFLHFLHALKA